MDLDSENAIRNNNNGNSIRNYNKIDGLGNENQNNNEPKNEYFYNDNDNENDNNQIEDNGNNEDDMVQINQSEDNEYNENQKDEYNDNNENYKEKHYIDKVNDENDEIYSENEENNYQMEEVPKKGKYTFKKRQKNIQQKNSKQNEYEKKEKNQENDENGQEQENEEGGEEEELGENGEEFNEGEYDEEEHEKQNLEFIHEEKVNDKVQTNKDNEENFENEGENLNKLNNDIEKFDYLYSIEEYVPNEPNHDQYSCLCCEHFYIDNIKKNIDLPNKKCEVCGNEINQKSLSFYKKKVGDGVGGASDHAACLQRTQQAPQGGAPSGAVVAGELLAVGEALAGVRARPAANDVRLPGGKKRGRLRKVAVREGGVRDERTVVLQHQQVVASQCTRKRVHAAEQAKILGRSRAAPSIARALFFVSLRHSVEEHAAFVRTLCEPAFPVRFHCPRKRFGRAVAQYAH